MKRKMFFILLAFVTVFWTLGNRLCAENNVIELTYATFITPVHMHCKLGESWSKEIENRSHGKVKISYFPGGSLLKGNQIYDGILKGVADIGMSCFAYTGGRFPAIEAIDLPMGYPTGEVATCVINKFYNKFHPKELENVKVLYLHAHGPGILHTRKPVYSLDDIKGMKIRSTGFCAKVTKALAAAPVGMPMGGSYEALQKSVVEGIFTPIEALKQWKLADVIKYTEECYSIGYTTGFYVIMNASKWSSLPSDIKAVFEDVSREWIAKHGKAWDESDRAGRDFTLASGNKIISLSTEENQKWADAVSPVIDEYIALTQEKGLPGERYIKAIREFIEECK